MSLDRPGETELELVERRGREADERARISDAAMKPCRDPGGVAFPRPWDRLGFWEYGR